MGRGGSRGESGRGHGPSIFEQKKGPTVSVSNIGDIAFHGSNFSFFSDYKGEFLKRSDTKSWTF